MTQYLPVASEQEEKVKLANFYTLRNSIAVIVGQHCNVNDLVNKHGI